jgi:hypothetical protein
MSEQNPTGTSAREDRTNRDSLWKDRKSGVCTGVANGSPTAREIGGPSVPPDI